MLGGITDKIMMQFVLELILRHLGSAAIKQIALSSKESSSTVCCRVNFVGGKSSKLALQQVKLDFRNIQFCG